ncbi:MAG: YjbH domain-containing protein [Nitrospirae bacterium]|nr:YjbH domain-containing protein [Nitrospirota bacterium]
MDVPSARVIRENSYRLGFSQINPYRYFYGAISPLKGLEAGGRITELLDVPSGLENQRNFKDKAVDLKYQFVREGKYLPALAVGIMDPHGTRVYPSQYIVASRQLYPFDFTLGFGNGRFGKKPLIDQTEKIKIEMITDTKSWVKDSQFFWGIQFAPTEKLALMVEYSPIKYDEQTTDPAQKEFFEDPPPSKYNFGLRYKPTKWSELDLSYQRGNTVGAGISLAFDIGVPLIPIYDPVLKGRSSAGEGPAQDRVIGALSRAGFSDIQFYSVNGEWWLEAQNDKYFYDMKAIKTILDLLPGSMPETGGNLHIVLKKNGITLLEVTTTWEDVSALYAEELTMGEFLYLSKITPEISGTPGNSSWYRKTVGYGIKPSLETFLNDPSGFFKYRLGVTAWAGYYPWKGATVLAGVEGYPLNNISTSNEPLSIPVRSDIALYKREKLALGRLLFDQVHKMTPNIYGKMSAGLLEIEYAGIDGAVAAPVLDGRFLLGISGSAVKKRDIDDPFALLSSTDDERVKDLYTTAFLNVRLNIHEMGLALDAKAGRFLAGDEGVRFTISKTINGVIIHAWYTFTDTSVFDDTINRNYNDKGIGISIPLRLFKGADSKTSYNYLLSPWTRDTGQDIDHFNTLFDFIGRNTTNVLDKDKQMMFK